MASLTVGEFEQLAVRFDEAWAAVRAAKTTTGTAQQRPHGDELKGCLVRAEQKLFIILLCCKAYPTRDVVGLFFGITQGEVSEWERVLTGLVGELIHPYRPTRGPRDLARFLGR